MPQPWRPLAAAVSSVDDSASVQTLLAANTARVGACIYNHSDQILYVKLGATATTSDFTVVLDKQNANGVAGYYEVPFVYQGIITGIWANNSTGAAKITEFTN